jgi:hypothetical protein
VTAPRRIGVKLVIADPPYPPFRGAGGTKNRASRWYGDGQRSLKDRPSDSHDEASEWDDPARHAALLTELLDTADGFAIATCPDGIAAYGEVPPAMRIMAWVKPNAQPGSHRLRSLWEPVLLYAPEGRRSNRGGMGLVPDVLIHPIEAGFIGKKPQRWTHWVLDALSYQPDVDTALDLFPGSGEVTRAIGTYGLQAALPFEETA